MLTRIEIDGFKTFEKFELDLRPFTAVVGPNASGKSNLFDAMQLLAALTDHDIHSAMQGLRGEPEEFFRQTADTVSDRISFAVEVLLDADGTDDFGRAYKVPAQRLRYELTLGMKDGHDGGPRGVFVQNEHCVAIKRADDNADYLESRKPSYGRYTTPFIRRDDNGDALLVRQDGPSKSGSPMRLSLREASRTALSTIATAEFPHLYALRKTLRALRFLEINPNAARSANDRFEKTTLHPNASNLAAVLNRLRDQTRTARRPDGVLADIATDLSSLIPSVCNVRVQADDQKQYSFSVGFAGDMSFSSRVISDGTLRILALLTILNDPDRRGTLCFEEPENGVHEGRIPTLIQFLRAATEIDPDPAYPTFQVILNTHSPKVMAALQDTEIVAADVVTRIDPAHEQGTSRTRMRSGVKPSGDLIEPDRYLVRAEVDRLLQRSGDAG
ncbi:AAA family ATPase [uncultured Sphingomonas sp.]|uniref:AAA family ATPase n=1 Tax=uncultured Sphingomonas sp. TaxID=158754 RepID=UPI0025DD84D6|nr:AAA family ATPase [uncultured Sphingomonas sp.]